MPVIPLGIPAIEGTTQSGPKADCPVLAVVSDKPSFGIRPVEVVKRLGRTFLKPEVILGTRRKLALLAEYEGQKVKAQIIGLSQPSTAPWHLPFGHWRGKNSL